jgi:hypothetical protein
MNGNPWIHTMVPETLFTFVIPDPNGIRFIHEVNLNGKKALLSFHRFALIYSRPAPIASSVLRMSDLILVLTRVCAVSIGCVMAKKGPTDKANRFMR